MRLTTLPTSCPVVMKSGNFNFLEPFGPLQACNGTALLLYFGSITFRSSAISLELIYSFRYTAAIMASFLFGVCVVRG